MAEGVPRSIDVVACGERVTVEIREAWADIGAITTAARWQAGCWSQAFDNFETRDETGRLLLPHAPVGPWLCGRTLYVNLLGGIGTKGSEGAIYPKEHYARGMATRHRNVEHEPPPRRYSFTRDQLIEALGTPEMWPLAATLSVGIPAGAESMADALIEALEGGAHA